MTRHISDNQYWEISISKGNTKVFNFYVNKAPTNCGENPSMHKVEFTTENNRKHTMPIFCGNDQGRHNTIYLINPLSQNIASLDLGDLPIKILTHDNKYYLFSMQTYLTEGEDILSIHYSMLYELYLSKKNKRNIQIKIADNKFSREKYAQKKLKTQTIRKSCIPTLYI